MPTPRSTPVVRDRTGVRVLACALVALLAHAGVLWFLGPLLGRTGDDRDRVVPLNAFELLAVYDRADESPPEMEREAVQFVALPPPDREERPDDARFRDQFERRADEETVSTADPIGRDAGPPAPPAPPALPPPRAPRARLAPQERRDHREPLPAPTPDTEGPGDDSPREREAELGEQAVAEASDALPGEPEPVADPSRVDLRAFRPTLERVGPAPGPPGARSDHLDLPEGERTQINALTSLYWSFFQRMREALLREWSPARVLRRHDPTQELYGTRDRYTILQITLNSDGSLRHAIVERSSGLDFLDQEAIRAFQVAAPFANVPEGMKDAQGRASFRFGFHVNYNRRPQIQWFQ